MKVVVSYGGCWARNDRLAGLCTSKIESKFASSNVARVEVFGLSASMRLLDRGCVGLGREQCTCFLRRAMGGDETVEDRDWIASGSAIRLQYEN